MATLEPTDGELTIDELAAQTRIPSRTIRFYQSKGTLPKPVIRGRVAYYGPHHVERLEVIGKLQDRGLKIRAMRELLERADRGEVDLEEWLGTDSRLSAGFLEDRPRVVSEEDLPELLGADPRPGLVGDLLRHGLIEESGAGYLVRSPAMLSIALEIERAGFGVDSAVQSHEILAKHIRKASKEVVEHFAAQVAGRRKRPTPKQLQESVDALVPPGLRAIKILFAKAMRDETLALLSDRDGRHRRR
ncbi:MAG: MerR family transcriptional regulator [Sandaracinaceae bacterium]|nr:MerR family transcriptional regulator [Sandaracinaceae bacterium]